MMKNFGTLSKKELILMFNMNLQMFGCMTLDGQLNVLDNLERIQDAYASKRGYGDALENRMNRMMKEEIAKIRESYAIPF